MSETKTPWTPGPWIADQRVIRDTGNHHVATAWRQDGGGIAGQPEPIADANARLIAAAPKLADLLARTRVKADALLDAIDTASTSHDRDSAVVDLFEPASDLSELTMEVRHELERLWEPAP